MKWLLFEWSLLQLRKIFNFPFPHSLIDALIVLCGLWTLASGLAQAQQLPQLSYATEVFNRVTGATVSPIPTGTPSVDNVCFSTTNTACAIQNRGQGQHYVQFCIVSGTVASIDIWLEGSLDGTVVSGSVQPTNWTQISPESTIPIGTNGCGTLSANNYFGYVRVHLGLLTGTSPVITAYYSAFGTITSGTGVLIQNAGSQPVTFNPANYTQTAGTFTSLYPVKSTPTLFAGSSSVIYGLSASNPNTVPVFAYVSCDTPFVTFLEWEIPANDTRDLPVGVPGFYCSSEGEVSCSTSATSAVDPTNNCLVNIVFKFFNVIRSQINYGGSVLGSQSQPPN